jgi:formate hydrogenlyase subunit 6/NADH:ubiquinone oxidoreductase subunit I
VTEEIYRKLARHLDSLPGGFPPTESGVELRILRRLFSPDEAELAVHLTLILEEPSAIAQRAEIPPEEAAARLEEMATKGLIFRIASDGKPPRYMAAQFVIGIWEYHVNDLDPDLIRDTNEYFPTLFAQKGWNEVPPLRTIPIGRSLTPEIEVLPYERAEEIISSQARFLVAPCICRREHTMVGKGCGKPEEMCLVFGAGADYYRRNGLGRMISREEALELLKKAEEAGLVLQPSNSQRAVNICFCCGCCCQILKAIKAYPKPADLVSSPFVASLDSETCVGCGTCLERCQMEALRLEDEVAALDAERCIGCGLCVSTCPTNSLALIRKPKTAQREVPRNVMEALLKRNKARGNQVSPGS